MILMKKHAPRAENKKQKMKALFERRERRMKLFLKAKP